MKKVLLLMAAGMMAASAANAADLVPEVLEGQLVTAISPDGRYVTSEEQGNVIITDITTGEHWDYSPGDDWTLYYSFGNGNCWSKTGVMVGCTKQDGDPAIWDNGSWKYLPNADNRTVYLTAINGDATHIIGNVGVIASDKAEHGITYIPAMWTLNGSGQWEGPQILPYPTVDWTGRAPQMINVICISDDAQTLLGQVQDYSGMYPFPIKYTKDADGNWQYTMLAQNYCNPDKVQFPTWIEDAPEQPNPEDFMNDAEYADYQAALEKYWETFDPADMPDPLDYMSGDMKTKYEELAAEYLTAAQEYNTMLETFFAALNKAAEKTTAFLFNNAVMTPDGRQGAVSSNDVTIPDPTNPWDTETINTPLYLDLVNDTDEWRAFPNHKSLIVSDIAWDSTLLGYTDDGIRHAYIRPAATGEWIPFEQHIQSTCPETYNFIQENCVHTYEITDYITGDTTSAVDDCILGVMRMTPDMSIFTSYAENVWDLSDTAPWYYSYILPTKALTLGVKDLVNPDDAEAPVEYFDLTGRRLTAPAPGTIVITRQGTTVTKTIVR